MLDWPKQRYIQKFVSCEKVFATEASSPMIKAKRNFICWFECF